MAVPVATLADATVFSFAVGPVVVVQQCGGLRVDYEVDMAAVAAVASIRSAQRLELLAVDGDAAVASAAGGGVQHHAVDEMCHESAPDGWGGGVLSLETTQGRAHIGPTLEKLRRLGCLRYQPRPVITGRLGRC